MLRKTSKAQANRTSRSGTYSDRVLQTGVAQSRERACKNIRALHVWISRCNPAVLGQDAFSALVKLGVDSASMDTPEPGLDSSCDYLERSANLRYAISRAIRGAAIASLSCAMNLVDEWMLRWLSVHAMFDH